MTVHTVPLDVPFYLSCPIDSYHAVYTWKLEGNSSPCMQMQSNCLHLIPAMAQENYGIYKCISREKDYEKVVKKYELKQQITQTRRDKKSGTENIIPSNDALKVVSEAVSIILGLATAGFTNCYLNLPALSFWNPFFLLLMFESGQSAFTDPLSLPWLIRPGELKEIHWITPLWTSNHFSGGVQKYLISTGTSCSPFEGQSRKKWAQWKEQATQEAP